MHLQESGEMYIETIYVLSQSSNFVRAIDVGERMGFSKPSVSRALKILRENGYITVDAKGGITLTSVGKEVAERMYERHHVIASLLVKIGVDPEIATEDSCKIEHVISEETFDKIKELLPRLN
ncbi:MAG: metal-dependent transcriptional regulator [Clostridia bacterium]|nr:metal-dependent transcriptional regulator [Clostridia bacterium]